MIETVLGADQEVVAMGSQLMAGRLHSHHKHPTAFSPQALEAKADRQGLKDASSSINHMGILKSEIKYSCTRSSTAFAQPAI
jgi:hypothetical protein